MSWCSKSQASWENQPLHEHGMVGPSNGMPSSANAMHSQEEWKITYGLWPSFAEWQHGEGCITLPWSRCNKTRHCTCPIPVEARHVWSLWADTCLTRRHPKDGFCNHLRHIRELGDATGWLQCPINFSKVDDCSISQLYRLIRPCLPGWHLHVFIIHRGTWTTPS